MAATELEQKRLAIERLFRAGQTSQALEHIERMVGSEPNDAGARFLQATVLTELGRATDAMAVLERMTQDFPALPEPFNNLAVLHAGLGRLDSSRELLEKALRNDPDYRTAHQNLGDILVRLALRAYEAAAGNERGDDVLQRKLKLTRELAGAPAKP